MTIKTYTPKFTVTLFKNVGRTSGNAQRYTKAQRTIELTKFLGDGTTIGISKDIYDPEGRWQITLPDQPDPTVQDTFYALIEPMDAIEIRGSRVPFRYSGKKLPLLMRGFVNNVRRSEAMGADGPERSVTVTGSDWGKLWKINGVWMEVALQQEKPLLVQFTLQALAGLSVQVKSVGDFMTEVTNTIINQKIKEMYQFTGTEESALQFKVLSSVKQGVVAPQAVGIFGPGPFWNLVKNFSDAPWNELWVDDSDVVAGQGGPTLVFRPSPFADIKGNWIGDATDPGTILVDSVDIMSMDLSRSDSDCANFFWTPPGAALLSTPNQVAASDILAGVPFDFGHANNNPALYGFRKMEFPTNLFPNSITDYPVNQAPDAQQQSGVDTVQWHVQRGQLLKAMNEDNVALEDGSIVVRGREDYRPGKYVQITRGSVKSKLYLTRIAHSIQIYGNWTTSLTVERGTGFLARNAMSGSPFWAEGRPGAFGAPNQPQTVEQALSPQDAAARNTALAKVLG